MVTLSKEHAIIVAAVLGWAAEDNRRAAGDSEEAFDVKLRASAAVWDAIAMGLRRQLGFATEEEN